jgi:hypothetical protein
MYDFAVQWQGLGRMVTPPNAFAPPWVPSNPDDSIPSSPPEPEPPRRVSAPAQERPRGHKPAAVSTAPTWTCPVPLALLRDALVTLPRMAVAEPANSGETPVPAESLPARRGGSVWGDFDDAKQNVESGQTSYEAFEAPRRRGSAASHTRSPSLPKRTFAQRRLAATGSETVLPSTSAGQGGMGRCWT